MAIEVKFLDIKDCAATGTFWHAPKNTNINSGNNLGWSFDLVYDFFNFFNIPLTTQDSSYRRIPRLEFTNIQDCNATGATFCSPTASGNIDNGNNVGINFS